MVEGVGGITNANTKQTKTAKIKKNKKNQDGLRGPGGRDIEGVTNAKHLTLTAKNKNGKKSGWTEGSMLGGVGVVTNANTKQTQTAKKIKKNQDG